MGIFDSGPQAPYHRVTVREYREHVVPALKNREFTTHDLGTIDGLIQGNMEVGDKVREGIDEQELATILSWLRSNRKEHSLSDSKIAQFESVMRKYLAESVT